MRGGFPVIRCVSRLIRDVRGQATSEYVLMVALVAFGATAGYRGVADGIALGYNHISTQFADAFGFKAAPVPSAASAASSSAAAGGGQSQGNGGGSPGQGGSPGKGKGGGGGHGHGPAGGHGGH